MKRRAALAAGMLLGPLGARAQPAGKVLRLGGLRPSSSGPKDLQVTGIPAALQRLGRVEARNLADLGQAYAAMIADRADAIYMGDASTLAGSSEVRKSVSEWALSRRLPVVAPISAFAADGALVALGADPLASARRAASYVHRILGGAKPGDLSVERPTVFRLTLNRKTATALGLTIPRSLLLRVDEVIQ